MMPFSSGKAVGGEQENKILTGFHLGRAYKHSFIHMLEKT